jgi:hypothetical protein
MLKEYGQLALLVLFKGLTRRMKKGAGRKLVIWQLLFE